MIIDFHAHAWAREDAEEAMAREAERHGIDRICLSALASWEPDLEEVRQLNNRVYKAACDYPDLYIPFVYLNPLHGKAALEELERGVEAGARGIKLWISCYMDHPALAPILERAIELDLVVLQHSWHKVTGNYPGESDPVCVAKIGRQYPELKIVMAHMGGDWRYGLRAVRDIPNIWADTSGSMTDNGLVEGWIKEVGAERLVWGTDMPGADLLLTLAKVRDADISPEEKALILGGNAQRLLKWPM